jgi:hypothetical protein
MAAYERGLSISLVYPARSKETLPLSLSLFSTPISSPAQRCTAEDLFGRQQSYGRVNGKYNRQVSCLVCERLKELLPIMSRPVTKLWANRRENEILVVIGFDATLEGAQRATNLSASYWVAFQRLLVGTLSILLPCG